MALLLSQIDAAGAALLVLLLLLEMTNLLSSDRASGSSEMSSAVNATRLSGLQAIFLLSASCKHNPADEGAKTNADFVAQRVWGRKA
jgi:hypothetical protein